MFYYDFSIMEYTTNSSDPNLGIFMWGDNLNLWHDTNIFEKHSDSQNQKYLFKR